MVEVDAASRGAPVSALVVGAHVWGTPPEEQLDHPTRLGLQRRLGGRVEVVARGAPGRWGSPPGPVITHLPTAGGAPAFVARALRLCGRLVRELPPPRVVVGSDVLGAAVAVVVARRTHVPALVQVQGDVLRPGSEYGGTVRRAVMGGLMRWAVARADGVRVVNRALASEVEAMRPGRPVYIVGSRVDLRRFEPGTEAAEPTIVAVGTLAAVKNHAVLIRALPGVLAAAPDAKLVIVGDGPERTALRRLAEDLGVARSVELVGGVAHEEVARLLRGAWVLALPSRSEGQPRVVLEAQASGTAVVASDLRSTRDLVVDGETGLLVPPDDVAAWARACGALLADADFRSRIAGAALTAVRSGHDQENGLDALAAAFRETAR